MKKILLLLIILFFRFSLYCDDEQARVVQPFVSGQNSYDADIKGLAQILSVLAIAASLYHMATHSFRDVQRWYGKYQGSGRFIKKSSALIFSHLVSSIITLNIGLTLLFPRQGEGAVKPIKSTKPESRFEKIKRFIASPLCRIMFGSGLLVACAVTLKRSNLIPFVFEHACDIAGLFVISCITIQAIALIKSGIRKFLADRKEIQSHEIEQDPIEYNTDLDGVCHES